MLDPREWLKEAQRLPVGATTRTYHGAERRPNIVVRNEASQWSAWCHACGDGGTLKKEFVKVQVATPTERRAGDPGFLRNIDFSKPDMNIPYSDIALFLHSKGMALHYIQHLQPKWSVQDKRIVLTTEQQVLGRDITNLSHSKWYKYSGSYYFVKARNVPLDDKVVIITEDLFSACKGQYFAPEQVVFVSVSGTRIDSVLVTELLKARRVVIMLDGDAAGDAGCVTISKTLRLVGAPCGSVRLPNDLDPKDMSPRWWRDFILNLEC